MSLELAPLPAQSLSPAVAKVVAAPPPARLMAAKGIAPLRPAELVVTLYQLSFDADPAVKAAAESSTAALPDKLIRPALAEDLPREVLHFFAVALPAARGEAHGDILYNRATADETFAVAAARLEDRELDIILQNEERLLRHPAIVRALYFNTKARMSSVNRAIELCVRNRVRVEGIPCYDDIAKSIGADPSATDPSVADAVFESVMQAADAAAAAEEAEGGTAVSGAPDPLAELMEERGGEADPAAASATAATSTKDSKRGSTVIDFTKLKLHEKIRLATLGNAYCRSNLMRDSNKMVAMAAIRSPGITDMEVVRASGNRVLAEDVVRYIATQKEYVKMYPVKLNLVQNPKCPLALSLRLLPFLHADDLKTVGRSRNIPSALATAAKRLTQKRGGG